MYRKFETSKGLGDYLRFEAGAIRLYVYNEGLNIDLPMDLEAFIRALDTRTLRAGEAWEVFIDEDSDKVTFVGRGFVS